MWLFIFKNAYIDFNDIIFKEQKKTEEVMLRFKKKKKRKERGKKGEKNIGICHN